MVSNQYFVISHQWSVFGVRCGFWALGAFRLAGMVVWRKFVREAQE